MDTILINGKAYSKKKLCLEWFQMDNDSFFGNMGLVLILINIQGFMNGVEGIYMDRWTRAGKKLESR